MRRRDEMNEVKRFPIDPFYVCDPEKATTCRKTTCFLSSGSCRLTLNREWAAKKEENDERFDQQEPF